ncbi:hypothetical protein [Microbacterium sp.]|uniref:hypothetical protein n=1 Tax=Microbacterium sp. TaxID=51671 RepID=UPI003A8B6490
MDTALDAILELFTWLGVCGAVLCGVCAVVLWVADGTWLPADAVVDHEPDGTWVRWFDLHGEANNAQVSGEDAGRLSGRDTATVWYRYGQRHRVRFTRRAPGVRIAAWATLVCAVMGALAFAGSTVLLFI